MMQYPAKGQLLLCDDRDPHLSSPSPSSSKTISLYAVAIKPAGMNMPVGFL